MSPLPLTLESESLGDGIMVNGELMAEMGNSAAPVGVSASAGAALPPPPQRAHHRSSWNPGRGSAVRGRLTPEERSLPSRSQPLGMFGPRCYAARCPCMIPPPLLWSSTPALPGARVRAFGNMSRTTGGSAAKLFQCLHCYKEARRAGV